MWHENELEFLTESTLAEDEREQQRLQALLEAAALRQQETAERLANMSLRLAVSIRRVRRRELLQAMFALRLGVAASRVLRSRARAMLALFRAKVRRLLTRALSRLVAATNRKCIKQLARLRGRVVLRFVWHRWNRRGVVDKRVGIAHFAARMARFATKSAWAMWLRSVARSHRLQINCRRLFSLARRVWTALAFETWAGLTHRLSRICNRIAQLATLAKRKILRLAFRCICTFVTRARFIERLAKRASSRQVRTAFRFWLCSTLWLLKASYIGNRFSRRQLAAALLKWGLKAKMTTKAQVTSDNAMKHAYMRAWSHETRCARWLRRRSLTSALRLLSAHAYSRRSWRRAAEARHVAVARRAVSALSKYATLSRRCTEKRERLRLERREIETLVEARLAGAHLASALAAGAAASAESAAKYSTLAATGALRERVSLALLMATEATACASNHVVRLKMGGPTPIFVVLERAARLCVRAGRRLALRRAWLRFRRRSKTVAACIALHAIFRARDTAKKKLAWFKLARRRFSAIQAWLSLQRAKLIARAFARLAIVAAERRTPRRLVAWASCRRSLKRALEHWRRVSTQNFIVIGRLVVARARRLAFARWRSAAATSKARIAVVSKLERAGRRRSQAIYLAAWRAKIAIARADCQKQHADQRRLLADRACALKSLLLSRPSGGALAASTKAAFLAWRLNVFSFKLHLLSLENSHLVSRLARLLQLQTDLSARMRDVIY